MDGGSKGGFYYNFDKYYRIVKLIFIKSHMEIFYSREFFRSYSFNVIFYCYYRIMIIYRLVTNLKELT